MVAKLLFVNASLTDGGSERAMSLVAQALVAHDYNVTMALVRDKEHTYPVDSKIRLVQFQYSGPGKVRKLISRMRQIRSTVKNGQYDFVICYMWDLNVTTLIATLGLQQRVIISERAYPGASTRSRGSRFLERILYKLSYRIVYQTRDAQEYCPPRLRSRSRVVPNIIETRGLEPYVGQREKRIVSIGRLGAQKNYPLLLRAFRQFLQSNPEWTLEIYGKGADEGKLRALVEELGITRSVEFAGYVSDITHRINDASIFALSSDYEGISNAMAEAMALGLPVVCTDCPVGGAALLIKNRESGMLVPVRDQQALASALEEVAGDNALAKSLSEGAQASVKRFSSEHMAQLWEADVLN